MLIFDIEANLAAKLSQSLELRMRKTQERAETASSVPTSILLGRNPSTDFREHLPRTISERPGSLKVAHIH
jgi:hypothetical protein